jgi:excisionase family DNA binding protein
MSEPIDKAFRAFVVSVIRDEVRRAVADVNRPDEYLSPERAAAMADVTPGTIRRWVRTGKLTRYGEGKRIVRISRAELEKRLQVGGAKNDEMSPEQLAEKRFG